MSEAATTPNEMPGAQSGTTETSKQPDAATSKADTADTTAAAGDLSAAERAELARLRDLHKDEQKYRREATNNHRDAEAYRNLLQALGVNDKERKEFDAQAAITDLNKKFEGERLARIRSEVARTEGVEPDDFTGSNEDEMRASAQRFKARIAAEVEKRAKAVAPAAAPAGEVTSNTKVDGPQQITSRDELNKMTREQRIKAHKEGRLDDLMSGKST